MLNCCLSIPVYELSGREKVELPPRSVSNPIYIPYLIITLGSHFKKRQ